MAIGAKARTTELRGRKSDQHEYYLPDVIAWLRKETYTIVAQTVACSDEVLGANTPEELDFLEMRAQKYT